MHRSTKQQILQFTPPGKWGRAQQASQQGSPELTEWGCGGGPTPQSSLWLFFGTLRPIPLVNPLQKAYSHSKYASSRQHGGHGRCVVTARQPEAGSMGGMGRGHHVLTLLDVCQGASPAALSHAPSRPT